MKVMRDGYPIEETYGDEHACECPHCGNKLPMPYYGDVCGAGTDNEHDLECTCGAEIHLRYEITYSVSATIVKPPPETEPNP